MLQVLTAYLYTVSVCSYFGIYKDTVTPYSAKSNLAELVNRLIIDCLRNLTSTFYIQPENINLVITPVLNIINNTPFTKHKLLSLYMIMFAQQPHNNYIPFYNEVSQISHNKEDYLKLMITLNNIAHTRRSKHIEQRKYSSHGRKTDRYYDNIVVGSLVSVNNPELLIHKENYNLRSKLKIAKLRQSCASFCVHNL